MSYLKDRGGILFLNLLSLTLFWLLAIGAFYSTIFESINNYVYDGIGEWHAPFLTRVMGSVSDFFHPGVLLFLAILIGALFALRKKALFAVIFSMATLASILSAMAIKEFMAIERPVGIIDETSFSFPSTHAAAAATFFTSALYALRESMKDGALENIITGLGILLIFSVGVSRLYLQVHWLSDVLAGFVLGVFWVTFFIIVYTVRVLGNHDTNT